MLIRTSFNLAAHLAAGMAFGALATFAASRLMKRAPGLIDGFETRLRRPHPTSEEQT